MSIYPAALLFQGWDVTCVYYHSLRNAFHANSIAFHSIHKCGCKSHHTVVIVFWHVTVLLLPHQGRFMPKCIQCTSLFYDETIQGWAVLKSLRLSTLLCLIHKGVMKMVAPLLWKCNSWLPQEMDLWSLVFYLTPIHSKIHQMAMSTQHWAQKERSGDRYAFRGAEGWKRFIQRRLKSCMLLLKPQQLSGGNI